MSFCKCFHEFFSLKEKEIGRNCIQGQFISFLLRLPHPVLFHETLESWGFILEVKEFGFKIMGVPSVSIARVLPPRDQIF